MHNENTITPTLTLAQLYEAQKQFFDAFVIYSQLYHTNPTDDLKDKLKLAEDKMFGDSNLEYNDIINIIFQDQEKKQFRILPNQNYEKYKQSIKNIPFEEIQFIAEEFPENEDDSAECEDIEVEYPLESFNQTDIIPQNNVELEHSEIETPTETHSSIPKKINSSTNKKEPSIQETLYELTKNKDPMNFTINEFAQFIVKLIGKDKKVSKLTLADIKKIFNEIM